MNEDKNNKLQAIASGAVKYSMVAIVSTLVAAFTSNLSQAGVDAYIKIKLVNETVNGAQILCPNEVDEPDPFVGRKKFVYWQSVVPDPSDPTKLIPTKYKFDIYFDPVTGRPIPSNAKGVASIKVDGKAPKVQYKYTIWDRDKLCTPLDPHFRVNQ
jgi:hypothetical protein